MIRNGLILKPLARTFGRRYPLRERHNYVHFRKEGAHDELSQHASTVTRKQLGLDFCPATVLGKVLLKAVLSSSNRRRNCAGFAMSKLRPVSEPGIDAASHCLAHGKAHRGGPNDEPGTSSSEVSLLLPRRFWILFRISFAFRSGLSFCEQKRWCFEDINPRRGQVTTALPEAPVVTLSVTVESRMSSREGLRY